VVKLLDFGIAKNTDQSSAEYTQTGTTQNMGTPMYMSPEQIKSTKEVTAQSDIYSLGVVLWQMVTGKKPYDINTISTFELQTKIVNEKLAPTNTLFDDVITGATAKDIINRYNSSWQLKNQLLQERAADLESTKLYNSEVSEQTLVQGKEVTENGKTKTFENILDSNLRTQQITGGNSSINHLSDKKNKGRKWVIIVFFFLTCISLKIYYDYIQRKTLIEYREYRDKIEDAGGISLPRAEWEKLKPRP
jgi:serine/threonine protein kinase